MATQGKDFGEIDPADKAFDLVLNEFLVSTYRAIERYEEKMLHAMGGLGLSVSEAHVVEAVGAGMRGTPEGVTVSQVAESLNVRTPTATASIKRLVDKGLLCKEPDTVDGRTVRIRLTAEGRKAFRLHAAFHHQMVDAAAEGLTPQERAVFASSLQKLTAFFDAAAKGQPLPAADVERTPSQE